MFIILKQHQHSDVFIICYHTTLDICDETMYFCILLQYVYSKCE